MVIIREFCLVLFTATMMKCVNLREQFDHIIRRNHESNVGLGAVPVPQRRFVSNPMYPKILGVPSAVEHLPRSEPIIPGRTLLLPEFGMLKTAIMFPHKELEDGAGVYGSIDKLGVKYDGRNERLLYTQFRRNNADDDRRYHSYSDSSGSSSDEDGQMIHMMQKYKKILDKAVHKLQGRRLQDIRISNINPFNKGLQIKSDKSKSLLHTLQKLKHVNKNKVKLVGPDDIFNDNNGSKEVPPASQQSSEGQIEEKKPEGFNDLQMTGDHFNLNSNAPEYHEVIPLHDIAKEEVTPWMYLCELQDVPH